MKHSLILFFSLVILIGCQKSDPVLETLPKTTVPKPPIDPTNPVNAQNPTISEITNYTGFELAWNDEFNKPQLDLSKWTYEIGTGVNGDFGTGQLDRATDRVQNVSMVPGSTNDGSLAITTTKETFMDRQYTSGRINTKDKFSFGPGYRAEARIWARDVKYKGQGFAFWMLPAEKPAGQDFIMWPQGGEIDVMEYVAVKPYANLGSVHYAWSYQNNQFLAWNHGIQGGHYSYEEKQVPAIDPGYGPTLGANSSPNAGSGAYHLYRIDYFKDRIEFSIDENIYHINYFNDGAAFANTADGQDKNGKVMINNKRVFKSEYMHHFAEWKPFEHQFYMILSAGVGGGDNTYGGPVAPESVFPCSVMIDYVRVYKMVNTLKI
jgi:beta-glucanase (GH16 family)